MGDIFSRSVSASPGQFQMDSTNTVMFYIQHFLAAASLVVVITMLGFREDALYGPFTDASNSFDYCRTQSKLGRANHHLAGIV